MKKRLFTVMAATLLITTGLASCGNKGIDVDGVNLSTSKPKYQLQDHSSNYIDDDYKNYYQILVYSYFDSNNDGIGDLKGLTSKLDYINDGNKTSEKSLGYDGIYLLPIFPSPTYHKYDCNDYYSIDPTYGTMEDFDNFMSEAKKRGIDVILDLALNHTSTEHHWFKDAMRDIRKVKDFDPKTGEPTESDKNKYPSLRKYHIVHKSMIRNYPNTGWNLIPGTEWKYEGSFYSGMPDLNYDEPTMVQEIKNIMKFWLDKGVKGFRLDAVKHFFDWNRKKSYDLLNQINTFKEELAKENGTDCFLVAEGPWNDGLLEFYDKTDGISYMNFYYGTNGNGELPLTLKSIAKYNRTINQITEAGEEVKYENLEEGKFDIVNDMFSCDSPTQYFATNIEYWDGQLYEIEPNAIDSNFGTNHDTIRAINQMSSCFLGDKLLDGEKLFWGINNTLSGVTYNYYGEEIGMRAGNQGNNQDKDPNKRHPMNWSETDKTGIPGFAEGARPIEQFLEPADKQMEDKDSLWNYMREVNRMKTYFPEIARGKQKIIKVTPNIVVMEKAYNDNKINLVYNFSEKASSIPLDELGLEGEVTEIKYSLSPSSSYFSKLSSKTLNVPGYSITII